MKKILICILFITLSSSCAVLNQNTIDSKPPIKKIEKTFNVKDKIIEILNSPELKQTKVGIKVVSLKTGNVFFEQDSHKLFVPASNLKIITALVALKILKPEYQFKTEFFTDNNENNSINNLYIKGYGDPSLDFVDLKKNSFYIGKKIKNIKGNIIADSSYFDNMLYGKGWMWDDMLDDYSAPVSAINLNRNCVDIYISPEKNKVKAYTFPPNKYSNLLININIADENNVNIQRKEMEKSDSFVLNGQVSINSDNEKFTRTISNPSLYTISVFEELLNIQGIKFSGKLEKGIVPTTAVLINTHESKKLSDIVSFFLKQSDNLTGECLLKTLGTTVTIPGTSENGVGIIKDFLKEKINIEQNTYRIVDGSGLSRYNLISPSIFIKILEYAHNDFSVYPEFINAFPIAGVDGTLKNRMKAVAAERVVRAKTGTMSGVSCISGYLTTKNNDILAVSIMMNGYIGSVKPFRDIQDKILNALVELQ